MTSDKKNIENTLVELNEVGLGAHGEHTYTFPVMLPANIVLPNFALCRLFSVEYKAKVNIFEMFLSQIVYLNIPF